MGLPQRIDPRLSTGRLDPNPPSAAVIGKISPILTEESLALTTNLERDLIPIHDFIARAQVNPRMLLRNVPQYLADAIIDYGFEMRSSYGRMLPHYRCLEADWLPEGQTQKKIPRDCDKFLFNLVSKLQEFGRQPRAEQGFMIRGMPGCGKDVIIQRLIETWQDYSRFHERGERYRLAFRFDSEDSSKTITGFDLSNVAVRDSRGYVLSSPTNCNPIFILANHGRGSSRERFVNECKKSEQEFNENFVFSNGLDPMSAEILKSLMECYHGDLKKVLNDHVVAERWSYNASTGEGIYMQLPYVDPNSSAAPLFRQHPLAKEYIPQELIDQAKKIPNIVSPFCKADVLNFEDFLADNARDRSSTDLSRLGHLLAYIERGDLQLASDHYFLTVNKDSVVIGTANDALIQNKSDNSTWEPLSKRFVVFGLPAIRQFREEIASHLGAYGVSIGPKTQSCPHVLETLCLFLTSTRMLNPQEANYKDIKGKTDENLGKIAAKLRGVRKALFFQSPEHAERHGDLNIVERWKQFSADEIKILRENERYIEEEYQRDLNKLRFGPYDGGIGIPTRDAKLFLNHLTDYTRGNKYISVLDVIQILEESLEAGFEYHDSFVETKSHYLSNLYKQKCKEANATYVPPNELVENAPKDSPKKLAMDIFQRAKKEMDEKFPVSEPAELIHDVETYARGKVRQDFKKALKLEDHKERIIKYFMHVRSLLSVPGDLPRDAKSVPDEYRTTKPEFTKGTSLLAKLGVDLEFIANFEKDVGEVNIKNTRDFRDNTNNRVPAAAFSSGGVLIDKELLFNSDHFQMIRKALKENAKPEEEKKIREFWEDALRYEQKPEKLDLELLESVTLEKAKAWQRTWQDLQDAGYHVDSIRPHFKWVFEKELQSK
jgi:hypothetical protein